MIYSMDQITARALLLNFYGCLRVFPDAKCFYKDGILIKIHHKLKKEIYIYLFTYFFLLMTKSQKKNEILL